MINYLIVGAAGLSLHFIYGFIHKRKKPDVDYKGWIGNSFGDFGGDKAEEGIQQAGQDVWERTKLTPEEEKQYKGSFGAGETLNQLAKYFMGLGSAPSGYLSPTQQYLQQGGELGQTLYNQVLGEAKDPYAYYESALQPQLQLAEDYINRGAQNRGLIRSGIPIEQMGRAGVELAIQEAQGRMNARQNALQQAYTLNNTISGQGNTNFANLASLYGNQQGYGLAGMNRQAQGAINTAPYYAYPNQAALGNAYGIQNALINAGLSALTSAGGALAGGFATPGGMFGQGGSVIGWK